MSDAQEPRELRPRIVALEIVTGLALLAISGAVANYAFHLWVGGKSFQAVELFGLSICFLGGCLDPINWIWICLPFTRNLIAESGRFAVAGWIIIGLGWLVFVVGMIGKYAHP
ncbi:hypothetical protein [Pelomonas sp. KK5]|uniref:hypothetical protein n=1 Tax=Pelomonas sp. KK5 TaxID=1855730 RepID=UPI00117E6587|nr:hypothetical protein [Pelomonas sp. KK5]